MPQTEHRDGPTHAVRTLKVHVSRKPAKRLEAVVSGSTGRVELIRGDRREPLPANLQRALRSVLEALGDGVPITVQIGDRPDDDAQPLTSQQVADLLNVSRPYVVKLAKRGELPYHRVGNRHRFARADVLAYKLRRDRHTERALRTLVPDEGYQPGDF